MDELHLIDYPQDPNDISDYERIIRAAEDAYQQHKTLVISGDLTVHKPLIFDENRNSTTQGPVLTRSLRGTGGHRGSNSGNSGKSRNGFCRITAIQDPSTVDPYVWQTQDAVLKVVRSNAGTWFSMEKITVDADDLAAYGIVLQNITTGTFRDLKASHATRGGIVLEACQTSHFDQIKATFNTGFGILMIRCSGAHFNHVTTTNNSGDGLVVTADQTQHAVPLIGANEQRLAGSGGLWIYGVHSEGNGNDHGSPKHAGHKAPSPQRGHAIVLYKISGGVRIDGGWIEGNRGDAIYLEDCRNASISNLRLIVAAPDDYYTYAPRWLRVQGVRSWGNVIEHIHQETINGFKEIGAQARVGDDVWDERKNPLFHGQKHLMVRFENENDNTIRPNMTDALHSPTLTFFDSGGNAVGEGKYLHIYEDCLQFVGLSKEETSSNGNTYTQIWDRSLTDFDPLSEAVTVESSGGWTADLVTVAGRILIAGHQLNRNYYKHSWQHVVTAPQIFELQHYIIIDDEVDGMVLAEAP